MTEKRMPELSELAQEIAREMTDEERAREVRCFVSHEDAGGICQRSSTMMVYGLQFCELHGEEAKIGALSELYFDAEETIERLNSWSIPLENADARQLLEHAQGILADRLTALDRVSEAALLNAYPEISERVCVSIQNHDYGVVDGFEPPGDMFARGCRELHRHMRQAYEQGSGWLVEILEAERESAAAQRSFARRDADRKIAAIRKRRAAKAST